jgi:hypothetical protein
MSASSAVTEASGGITATAAAAPIAWRGIRQNLAWSMSANGNELEAISSRPRTTTHIAGTAVRIHA